MGRSGHWVWSANDFSDADWFWGRGAKCCGVCVLFYTLRP